MSLVDPLCFPLMCQPRIWSSGLKEEQEGEGEGREGEREHFTSWHVTWLRGRINQLFLWVGSSDAKEVDMVGEDNMY